MNQRQKKSHQRLCWAASLAVCGIALAPAVTRAASIVSTSLTVSGGTYTVSPADELVIHGPTNPLLTLTNAAKTSGVEGLVIGASDGDGQLLINANSTLSNSGNSSSTGLYGGVTVSSGCGYLGLNHGSAGSAIITGLKSNWNNSGFLQIGCLGTGSMKIEAGGTVTDSYALVGASTGSTGAVTVTGAGSNWTSSVGMYVGYSGSGAVRIESGGSVTAAGVVVCNAATAAGSLLITGAGSKFVSTEVMEVGHAGLGILRIENGGQMNTTSAFAGYTTNSSATIAVSGAGSVWNNSSYLHCGNANGTTTTLQIEAGGRVTDTSCYLGRQGGNHSAIVNGIGSTWSNTNELYVGYYVGSASLTVSDGGLVTANTLYANLADLHGNGTIQVSGGAVLDADLLFDRTRGASQTLSFGSGGSLGLSLSGLKVLGAGYKANGSIRIADGGEATSLGGYLGYMANSTGTATVTGTGSKWTINTDNFYIGNYGNGSLRVDAGAQVNSRATIMAYNPGATASALVTGPGTSWTNSQPLEIGHYGSATLRIADGAQVSDTYGFIAWMPQVSAAVTVTGSGSTWTNTNNLHVGYGGNGRLSVSAGAKVSDASGYIGANSSASGQAIVTGAGSKWSNASLLSVGGTIASTGKGSLTICDAAQVTASSISIYSKSSVRLHVSNDGMLVLGNAAATGSMANSGSINLYADPRLAAGVYRPITEYADRTITWSGTGTVTTVGGVWDSTSRTFTVGAMSNISESDTVSLSDNQRITISNGTSDAISLAFGTGASGKTLSADPMVGGAILDLMNLIGTDNQIADAWNFNTDLPAGVPVMLTFDIGPDALNPQVWHYSAGAWSLYAPSFLSQSTSGLFTFTVDSFSGYAVSMTAIVPEPSMAAWGVMTFSGLMLRRRRK